MTKNLRLLAAAFAILLIILFFDQIKAGVRMLSDLRVNADTVKTQDPAHVRTEQPARADAAPETQRRYKTCLDGTALTVTGRDSNQTNYRCASGAIGAYSN